MDTCVVPTFLATMNNIAMNIGVQNFKTLLSIFLVSTEVELMDHMVILVAFFECRDHKNLLLCVKCFSGPSKS